MAITCNFDREDCEDRKEDKVIVRIPAGQTVGSDAPASSKPVKHGAYLWVLGNRRRPAKSWRDNSSLN
jgi:hypothetical protein